MGADLLDRKRTHFVLWRPRRTETPPALVIGRFRPGNPPRLRKTRTFELTRSPLHDELWEIAAEDCRLRNGRVYHYWFEVDDSNPHRQPPQRIRCTDPTAWTVDWRLRAPLLAEPYGEDDRDPAAVILYEDDELLPCDPGGDQPDWSGDVLPDRLPPNNRLVLYELPTSWSRVGADGEAEIDVGSFRDVRALIDPDRDGANFAGTHSLERGRAHLLELGINALELLPPADSWVSREWGYATSNYFAADHDLGFPHGHASPTPTSDLTDLVATCHAHGIRFFADVVMAFATRAPYQNINFLDFHVTPGVGDPDEAGRDGFGGDLFRYNRFHDGYDPITGERRAISPARQWMQLFLERWMRDFRIDGLRLDSVVNIDSWDFVQEYRDAARALWRERWYAAGLPAADAEARFLVAGEELAVPLGLITENRLDALWNEPFKRMVRHAIEGRNDPSEPSFEWTVRKLIDCRLLGFRDGSEAINYVTSHDVEGFRNERLFDLLVADGVFETEQHIKLAFVCLLTAVGIPMILAGEEFADRHDLPVQHPHKQRDSVNFDRLDDPWRRRIFDHVARLVALRTRAPALAVNDTEFFHADFTPGRRILAWRRGGPADPPVVVVANFSDWGTENPESPAAEYVVPNWPAAPPGARWREVTQDREVPLEWIGREPLYPWEAKVYTWT
jgi:glycosidase